ncbi:membrane protein [Microbacterium phage Figueroism]|nr:membrane protein [Microbacterium phage Figueroism]
MRKKIAFVTVGTIAALAISAWFVLAHSPAAALPLAPEPTQAPVVHPVPELPEWAQGTTWLVYPEGFQCWGTEGCPNSYRSIAEPGPVLPEGVEYYDPAKHDCVLVQPADVTC